MTVEGVDFHTEEKVLEREIEIENKADYFNLSSLFNKAPEGSKYILETRVRYLSTDKLRGSHYFLDRIGYDPDEDLKLVGDPFYESQLITREIEEKTGKKYLEQGIGTDTEQIERLYDNSYAELDRLKEEGIEFDIGIALTPDQISSLKKDIIWVEKELIVTPDGKIVEAYVPKLYLADFDENKYTSSTISATNIEVIGAGEINNYGDITGIEEVVLSGSNIVNEFGNISSEGNLELVSENNIINDGGEIRSEGNLSLDAGGSIANTSKKETYGDKKYGTDTEEIITSVGSISGGDVSLKAGDDINIIGAQIESGGDMALEAGNEVNILSETTTQYRKQEWEESSVEQLTTTVHSSKVDSGGNLSIKAGEDINVLGSIVEAKEDGEVVSEGGNITIKNDINRKIVHTIETEKGEVSSSHDEVYSRKEEAVSSELNFGGFLVVKAEGGFLVEGSKVDTGEDLMIGDFTIAKDEEGKYKTNEEGVYETTEGGSVENVVVKAAELRNEHWEVHTKENFNIGAAITNFVATAVESLVETTATAVLAKMAGVDVDLGLDGDIYTN